MVHRLLKELGMIDPAFDPDQMAIPAPKSPRPRVALYDAGGTGGQGEFAVERILAGAGMDVLHVGPEEIAAGALPQFQLLIVPGGSGSREAAAIGAKGREQIRQFVQHGGGYMGICAGAYLCTSGYDWSLKIFAAKPVSSHWQRGRATLKIELTPEGRRILGDQPGPLNVLYHNGPVVQPAGVDGLPPYEVLACFRSEAVKKDMPVGAMIGSPAIAISRYGQGRVVFISPHPEQSADLKGIVLNAARWAADDKAASSRRSN
jgi:putative intracellular protease/amidase